MQITIAAEVARNYFSLRSTQEQISVARSNLANQEETVRLTSVRYDSGRGAELDLQEPCAAQGDEAPCCRTGRMSDAPSSN